MKGISYGALLVLLPLAWSCGSSQDQNGGLPPNLSLPATAVPYLNAHGRNVLSVTVGGSSLCGQSGYLNEPCTTVKVCVPGTDQCQTIPDILLDTGSVGLRVFSSALNLDLPQRKDASGNALAECAQFGIGSDWGPLVTADVVLGNEPPVTVPIQLINKGFTSPPQECSDADVDPASAGFNGILGVGPFNEDCGSTCAQSAKSHFFFSCPSGTGGSGANCTPIALPSSEQPQNPISHLPDDNNGVLIALQQVGLGGASQVSGVLVLGVGTQVNNVPQGVSGYGLDAQGNFTTQFQGQSYPGSFIDSGSNGIYFPNSPSLDLCPDSGPAQDFYCPSSTQTFSAINLSASWDAQASVPFAIGNAEKIAGQSNTAFVDLGGPASESFDWGLPFFYGRAVFEVIQGRDSPIGSGPALGY